MPNRILKETICTSDSIDSLGWFEEVLFYRLIVNCDDYGRFDGRPSIIKNRLFPLKENLTVKNVSGAIEKLARAELVTLYSFEGKPYLYLPTWNHHQNVRAKRSKYPAPEDGCLHNDAHESICMQMYADDCKCSRNPIQSVSESESNPNDSAEPLAYSAPPVITLTLNDGTEYPVSEEQCHEWAGLYPAVDVIQQLRQMKGWLDANPTKRKTKRGINAFIVRWLAKEQDRGGGRSAPKAEKPFVYDYGSMEGCL